ncbi:MAG: SirB1 family protein [Ottowia sp.]|nr:SirB1 family protein [Ottowia sp.]
MPTQLLDYFSNLVADDRTLPLTEAALSIAQDPYPDLDVQAVLAEIDTLTFKLRSRVAEGTPPLQKLRLLNQFFYRELGFHANSNDFYDPDSSYLHLVLKSRRGTPISLAVMYMEMGQQIGLPLRGVPFPNHFLVRMTIPAGEVFIDPLTGVSLTKEDLQEMLTPYLDHHDDLAPTPLRLLLQDASPREILAHALRHLKDAYLQDERWERLLGIQQRLVILLPNAIEEVRDRGLTYASLEYFKLACTDLQAYLDKRPEAADAQALRDRIPKLKQLGKIA